MNENPNEADDKNRLRSMNILLVDDDEGDVFLTIKAFEKGRFSNSISVVSDGVEALQFLRQEEPYANEDRPDLVLLDLNMPRKDGRETLEEMSKDPRLKDIPVVVLTTSDADQQVVKDCGVNASFYMTKPVNVRAFHTVVQHLPGFGLELVRVFN